VAGSIWLVEPDRLIRLVHGKVAGFRAARSLARPLGVTGGGGGGESGASCPWRGGEVHELSQFDPKLLEMGGGAHRSGGRQ
jgi:hypothetical protein